MAKKLTCVVTGKTTSINDDYYSKRVEEHGDEQLLTQRYVCKQVKSLLTRGYSVAEVRDMLNVKQSLPDVSPDAIAWIMGNSVASSPVFHLQTSDERVTKYINTIKNRRN